MSFSTDLTKRSYGKGTEEIYNARKCMALHFKVDDAVKKMEEWGTSMSKSKYETLIRYIRNSPQERYNNLAMWEYAETVFNLIDSQKFIYEDLLSDYVTLTSKDTNNELTKTIPVKTKDGIEMAEVPIDPLEIMLVKTRIAKQLSDTAKLIQNATSIEKEQGNAKSLEHKVKTGTKPIILN